MAAIIVNNDITQEKKENTVTPVIIDSSSVGEHSVYEAWRESFSPLFEAIPQTRFSPEYNSIEACPIDSCLMIRNRFNASIFRRSKQRIDYYDNDCALFCLWLRGNTTLENSGSYINLSKGGAFIIDMGRVSEAISSSSDVLALVIPKPMLKQHGVDINKLNGIFFADDDPRFEILLNTYKSTYKQRLNLKEKHTPSVSKGLVALLASFISKPMDNSSKDHLNKDSALNSSILSLALDYIDENIANPRLGAKLLLQRFPLSRSRLYRLFEQFGGVAQFIKNRRLHKCYKILANPTYASTPIRNIAESLGFSNNSHFCKLFKSHFGLLPSEVQELARTSSSEVIDNKKAVKKDQQIDRVHNWLLHTNSYFNS